MATTTVYPAGIRFPRLPHAGQVHEHNGVAWIFESCHRCGGTGEYSYNPMHGTTCFGCAGRRGHWLTKADADRRAARRVADAARRVADAERFAAGAEGRWAALVERHPLLAELSYRVNVHIGMGYAGPLGDLLRTFETKGGLTSRQIAFAEKLIRDDMAAEVELGRRAAALAAEKAARVNAAIGEAGDRREFTGTVRWAEQEVTEYAGRERVTTTITLDTAEGTVKWDATGAHELRRGDALTFTATVKKHYVAKSGEIVTVVTRGKISR